MSKNFNINLEKHDKVEKDLEQDKRILENAEIKSKRKSLKN